VRKLALVLAAAMFAALVPTMTASGAPVSAQATSVAVRFINLMNTGNGITQPIDICVDGVKVAPGLPVVHHVDTTVPAGAPGVVVVASPTASLTSCAGAAQSQSFSIPTVGGTNLTVAVNDASGTPGGVSLAVFTNDTSPTAIDLARLQVHNDSPQSADICINGGKVLPNLSPGGVASSSGEVETPHATPPVITVISPSSGVQTDCASGTAFPLPSLAAGTNTIITLGVSVKLAGATPVGSTACGTDPTDSGACVQVLQVGQGAPVNNASTASFCQVLQPGLTNIQAEIKSVLGGITFTSAGVPISSTFPTVAAVKTLVGDINAVVAAGDASVPATVKPQFDAVAAGLTALATGLTSAGFDVSKIPAANLKTIVDGINSTPSATSAANTQVLTAFFLTNCGAAVTTAAPKFTG
jgi:hypothetical protein